MREIRSSGSVEGVMGNHNSYSDSLRFIRLLSRPVLGLPVGRSSNPQD